MLFRLQGNVLLQHHSVPLRPTLPLCNTFMVSLTGPGCCIRPLIIPVCLFPLSSCASVWQRVGCREGDFLLEPDVIYFQSLCLWCVFSSFITSALFSNEGYCCTCMAVLLYFDASSLFMFHLFLAFCLLSVDTYSPSGAVCSLVKCWALLCGWSAEAGSPSTSVSWREDPRTTGSSWLLSPSPGTKTRR